MDGDVFQFSLLGEQGSSGYTYTAIYQDQSGSLLGVGDWAAAAQELYATWADIFAPALSSNVNLWGSRLEVLVGPSIGAVASYEAPTGVPGLMAAPFQVPEVTICLRRKVAKAGRQYRGRLFFGPITNGLLLGPALGLVDRTNADLQAVRDLLKTPQDLISGNAAHVVPILFTHTTPEGPGPRVNGAVQIVEIAPYTSHHKSRRTRERV